MGLRHQLLRPLVLTIFASLPTASSGAQDALCGLSFQAVDPFLRKHPKRLDIEGLRPAGSKGPDFSHRFKGGSAWLPCGKYDGLFRLEGDFGKDRIDGIPALQRRDVYYVALGSIELRIDRFGPSPVWHGRVWPVPPGRRAWVKFSAVAFDEEASVETDESGKFSVLFMSEGLFSVVVVWDHRVQYTGTIRAEYERNFLDINIQGQTMGRKGKGE